MKQFILGTAGHIDHGKTALVKALTGIDTDRLKEEKERGITIELGFANLELPGGKLLGIVDVPGHERFVKNMVAGATGIDLVALIIAADEGVMPQTREHLEICELLKVKHGIVVLTKIDLVETDWLDMVKEDIKKYLSQTFLADAPLVSVSSTTGDGIKELIQVLDGLVQQIPEREQGHIFRLPIDRVFTMKGFGTVVTGTTVSGEIHTNDEITIYPQETDARIRGIQVHNREVKEVRAGLRTAINLQGVEKSVIRRGDILAAKDALRPTYMVDVILELLKSAPRILKNRAKARFHTGTSEIICTVVLLDRDELKQGDTCFAQIRLDEPTSVLRQDHYVIRSYSPIQTIGGGEILNPLPVKRKRHSKETLTEMETLHSGEINHIIELFVGQARFTGLEQVELPFLTNISAKRLEDPLKSLLAQKRIVQYDKEKAVLIHTDFFKEAMDDMVNHIGQYHKKFPLKPGLAKEELRSRTVGSQNPKLFNHIINRLTQEGIIIQEKETVRLKGHQVTLAEDQEQARRELAEIYLKSGLKPPYFKDLRTKFSGNMGKEIVELLTKEGTLLKVKEDLFFHKQVITELEKKLIDFLKKNGEINTPQLKELTGVSRKYTIPLIEYFDRQHITVRVGDSRVLRKK